MSLIGLDEWDFRVAAVLVLGGKLIAERPSVTRVVST